jgi:sulfite reductase (NADPH) hemoprotein beta-component
MFRAAKEGPAKVITANDLRDGLVVFLDHDGGWTHDIALARVVEDGPDLDQANAYAKAQDEARIIVEPYPVDVTVTGGVPVPVRLREKIRADKGPTIVYGHDEVAKLSGEAGK